MSTLWKKTLGVIPSNRYENVKKKYRKLALVSHPNKPGGTTEAFQKLGHAWEVAQEHYSRPVPRPRPQPKPRPPKKKPAKPMAKPTKKPTPKKPTKPHPAKKPKKPQTRPSGRPLDPSSRAPVVMTDAHRPIMRRLCTAPGEVRGADIETLWNLKRAAMQCALPPGGCVKLRNMWETPYLEAYKILRGDAAIETDIRTMNYLVRSSRLRNVMPELYDAGKALFDEIRRVAELGGVDAHARQNGFHTPAYDAFLELVRRGHISELAPAIQAFKNVRDGLLRCFDTRASRHLNAHRLVPAHARDTRAEHFLAKLVDEFKEKICDSSKWSSWF